MAVKVSVTLGKREGRPRAEEVDNPGIITAFDLIENIDEMLWDINIAALYGGFSPTDEVMFLYQRIDETLRPT